MEWLRPDTAVMMLGLIGLAVVLWIAQRKKTLDLADAFKDEEKRTSAGRIVAVSGFMVASWYVMHEAFDGGIPEAIFVWYLSLSVLMMLGSKGLDILHDVLSIWVGKRGDK